MPLNSNFSHAAFIDFVAREKEWGFVKIYTKNTDDPDYFVMHLISDKEEQKNTLTKSMSCSLTFIGCMNFTRFAETC